MITKLFYITTTYPFGAGESFLGPELEGLIDAGFDITIVPRDSSDKIKDSFMALENKPKLLANKLINLEIIYNAIVQFLFSPIKSLFWTYIIIRYSGKHTIKNLAILPKALWLARKMKKSDIDYVHVHWGGVTSTMAMVASEVAGKPWSLTCHRWDIYANNLLAVKSKYAQFIRFISIKGMNDARQFGVARDKSIVSYLGVKIPNIVESNQIKKVNFTIMCPANLLPVKGHKYLLEAIALLAKEHKNIQVLFAGQGELFDELNSMVDQLNIKDYITFLGNIDHGMLMEMYRDCKIDCVVLPSVDLGGGLHEGIPVSLMEAMSHFIPVISTNTGSINELLNDNAGIIVEEKKYKQLCEAIKTLMLDDDSYHMYAKNGYDKVSRLFDIDKNINNFIGLIRGEVMKFE